jgi:glycosyltransferase involved in cell wall biosynthesis
MKIKVCYIIQLFPVPTETFIVEEVASVIKAGHEAHLLFLNQNNAAATHPAVSELLASGRAKLFGEFTRLDCAKAFLKLFARQPARTIRCAVEALRSEERWRWIQILPRAAWCIDERVTNIHAHFADLNLVYAQLLANWTGIPFGVTTHRYDILDNPIPVDHASHLFSKANPVITVSLFNRDLMEGKFSLRADRINVVHCGIDLMRFSRANRPLPRPRESPMQIVTVGRLAHQKGHDILFRALRLAADKGLRFTLQLIGDGPERDRLEELAVSLDIAEHIVFRGVQNEREIVKSLQAAEVFAMASRTEGIPVACMESMACEVPVLTTRIMGLPELVIDGKNGFLADPESPSSFAAKLLEISEKRADLPSLGRAARLHVEAEFSRPVCTVDLIRLLQTSARRY